MTRSLKGKLILTYLAVALMTVLVVSVLIRLTSGQSLMNLVVEEQTASLKSMAEEYYSENGAWDGFLDYYLQSARQQFATEQPGMPEKPPEGAPPEGWPENVRPPWDRIRGVAGMVDAEYKAILPSFGIDIGQKVPEDRLSQKVAVEVDGETVAWILPDTSFQFRLSAEEQLFLQRTTLAISLAALAGVMVALVVGFFFAARLLKPIRLLTQAAQGMARGELNQQVPVTSKDELGQLTATFNQMSTDLDQADQQRKRLTADITHDLSTPIQIISGYMEMLEEGDAALTPQRIEIIKTELDHLRRLVTDLSTLTQVEAGALEFQMEQVQLKEILGRIHSAFQPIAERQGVRFTLETAGNLPPVRIDVGRTVQVLKNLLENALRHTPRGGEIQLGASSNEGVQIWVQDTGEGIDPDDLPYVFDRFFRADKARNASSGKMGLGLAICKALIEAQGGTIAAESEGKDKGTIIRIRLNNVPYL